MRTTTFVSKVILSTLIIASSAFANGLDSQVVISDKLYKLDLNMVKSMIKNNRIGNCQVDVEQVNDQTIRLKITQDAFSVYEKNTQTYQPIKYGIKVIDVNLKKAYGYDTFALDDHAGYLALGEAGMIFFDSRTRLAYRLVKYRNMNGGELDCATISRP